MWNTFSRRVLTKFAVDRINVVRDREARMIPASMDYD